MPIDASLFNALGQRPRSVADFDMDAMKVQETRQGIQQNAMNLQIGQQKMQEYQRGVQESGVLRNALMGLGGNATDEQRINALKGTGLPGGFTQADALEKALGERQKTKAEVSNKDALTASTKQKTYQETLEFALRGLARANDAQSATEIALKSGIIEAKDANDYFGKVPKDPVGFAAWRREELMQGVDAAKRFDIEAGAARDGETKRHNVSTESNASGQLAVSQGQLGVSQQNLGVARERLNLDKAAPKGTYDPERGIIVDTRNGSSTPVTSGGVPIGPKAGADKLTEDQGKATGWLVQANNAFGNMQAAMKASPSSAKPGFNDFIGAAPFGIGEPIANTMRGAERQKFMQGSSSLSESLLRAATGAGVNKEEALQKIRELTPVFGEADSTTKQKMAAIPLYIESLKVRAGPGAKKAEVIAAGASTPGGNDIHSQAEAILKGK